MHFLFTRLAPAMALSLPLLAQPQQGAAAPTAAPAPSYQSAFADYKPWQEVKPGQWRRLNDSLAKPSGHAGHGPARPASAAAAEKPAATASLPAQGQGGHHRGHHHHGARQ